MWEFRPPAVSTPPARNGSARRACVPCPSSDPHLHCVVSCCRCAGRPGALHARLRACAATLRGTSVLPALFVLPGVGLLYRVLPRVVVHASCSLSVRPRACCVLVCCFHRAWHPGWLVQLGEFMWLLAHRSLGHVRACIAVAMPACKFFGALVRSSLEPCKVAQPRHSTVERVWRTVHAFRPLSVPFRRTFRLPRFLVVAAPATTARVFLEHRALIRW